MGLSIDRLVSHFVHGVGRVRPAPPEPAPPSDAAILARVESDLSSARTLKHWWESTGRGKNNSPAGKRLTGSNRRTRSARSGPPVRSPAVDAVGELS